MNDLEEVLNPFILFEKDENSREIKIFLVEDAEISGQLYYPGTRLYSHKTHKCYNPIRECIMSLPNQISNSVGTFDISVSSMIERRPVFFFIVNLDNFFHTLYDSLPYLISYRYLKQQIPELLLLTNFANNQQIKHHRFVLEFLEMLNISEDDLIYPNTKTIYSKIFVSSSYTHDGLSNSPPRQEIYSLYKNLANKVEANDHYPKKIYVSRRSYKHGNYENIGTNYTTRRKLVNEDELVYFLASKGYLEVFTELLSTQEKIALFKNCTHVVGPIGGGLCNVLFSKPETKLISIVSPHFLDINARFCYSFANVKVDYFKDTKHVETDKYKKHMRVLIEDMGIVGEIKEVEENSVVVMISPDVVAGWNAQTKYETMIVAKDEVKIIDNGLNSKWTMDMEKFKEDFNG